MAVLAVLLALGAGLGVGLTRGQSFISSSDSTLPVATDSNPFASIWKPRNGTTWQYELLAPINAIGTHGYDVWDIDLFENAAAMIGGLQHNGARVICYFSAGSYESWRPDKDDFADSDLGQELDGWPGERWLNISSPNVRDIILRRLDLAVEKGCDGVDPDNVDGYNNDNGLDLTQTDSVNYLTFLADAAHERNLAIGLKNAGEIVLDVIEVMEWSVNEQCVQFDECDVFAPFVQQGKPVFHVEYPKEESASNEDAVGEGERMKICGDEQSEGFSTIMKNVLLDDWMETCSG